MNLWKVKLLFAKLEPIVVGVLLLHTASIALSPAVRSALNALSYPLVMLLILLSWKKVLYTATKDIFILLLVGIAVASIFWSAAPEFTSDEVRALVRSTALGVFIAARYSPTEQARILACCLGLAAILSLLSGLATSGAGQPWRGIFTYKNFLAAYMIVGAVIFILTSLNRNQKHYWIGYFGACLTVLLLILSQSKTGYGVFCVLLCMLPIQKIIKQEYRLRVVIFTLFFLLIGGSLILLIANLEFILVDAAGKDLEFNGRLPIWILLFEKISESPLLGYGYAGFWTSSESLFVLRNTWASSAADAGIRFNSHNGYIEVALQLGLIGLSLYIFSFITTLLKIINLMLAKSKSLDCFWMLLILIAIFCSNFADPVGAVNNTTMWSIFVSIAFTAALQTSRLRRARLICKV